MRLWVNENTLEKIETSHQQGVNKSGFELEKKSKFSQKIRAKWGFFLAFCKWFYRICEGNFVNFTKLILFSKNELWLMSHWNQWYSYQTFRRREMEEDLKGKSGKILRVTLLYCSKWLCQFLVQAFGWFQDGTSRSLDLPRVQNINLKNHPKLTQRVF